MGIFMLKDHGILSFISPNSFLKNTSQTSFRKFLLQDSLVKEIIDFGSSKIFPDADTYTCICTLMKGKNTEINYRRHDIEVCLWERTFDETYIRKNGLFFLDNDTENFWKENTEKIQKVKDVWNVQNGVATNLDQVYIGEVFLDKEERKRYFGKYTEERQMVWFHGHMIESDILHRCVKESRYNGGKITEYILYPYENGKLITEDIMKEKFPNAYTYLRENKERLEKRNMENGIAWYAFGRSQGLRYMEQPKVIFKHIVKNQITPYLLEEDVVVYSGLFSIGENLEKLMENYSGKEFLKYCRMMGKPMRGDYVSISSKMVKNFGID